jgi:hypothetical protein
MPSDTELLERLYDSFNARDIGAALATMHPDVVWANGLEGGHVHGHDGVRDYWTRQWAMMDSHAEPSGFSIGVDYPRLLAQVYNQVIPGLVLRAKVVRLAAELGSLPKRLNGGAH